MKFIRKIFEWFKAWIMVAGTLGFCLFILEESSQVATFSTFMSKTNQDYALVLKAADLMTYNNNIIITINRYIGWINPFGYISYNQYAKAQQIYADACILFVLRNEPALLEGREIEIEFMPKEIISLAEHYLYRNGKIAVISDTMEPLNLMKVKGVVRDGKIHSDQQTQKRESVTENRRQTHLD